MSSLQTVGSRIQHVRKIAGLTQAEFAKRLSSTLRRQGMKPITRGAVGNWELGKGIKTENLRLISEVFRISFEWLASGRGKAPKREGESSAVDYSSAATPGKEVGSYRHGAPGHGFAEEPGEEEEGFLGAVSSEGRFGVPRGEIPQVDARLGLGTSTDAQRIEIPLGGGSISALPVIATWKIPETVLRRRFGVRPGQVHIIECKGDSMAPRVQDGDYAFIDTSDRVPSPPGIFAIYDGFGHSLKWIEPVLNSDPPLLAITAENPKHKRYELPVEEVSIVGRMICRLTME